MATHSITITEEAYKALKRKKRETESFTDVILRLTGEGNIRQFRELLESKDFPDRELADNIEKASKEFGENFKLRNVEL